MKINFKTNKGFTLIELLVVVSIIGLLASVVMTSLQSARAKGRDAKRMLDVKQIQNALELYRNANGRYPQRDYAYTDQAGACGGNASWCGLKTDLAPHISAIPGDPLGKQNNYMYYYDADAGDNYQSYGMMIRFEHSSNFGKATNDDGFSGYRTNGRFFEVGDQPKYCAGKSRTWWSANVSGTTVCAGSN